MTTQTNIRIDKIQAKRSKNLRKAAKGAQIGTLQLKHRKPTHTEIYAFGLDYLEAEMKKAK
jgi:hypothetical protein